MGVPPSSFDVPDLDFEFSAAPASVLLGLIGPDGMVDRVVAGDVCGGVNLISLDSMEVVDRFVVGNTKIRSLCASSISGESILVGCENGSVFMIGANVPNRVLNLFDLDGPASALRKITDFKSKLTGDVASIEEYEESRFDQVMEVNAKGPFLG